MATNAAPDGLVKQQHDTADGDECRAAGAPGDRCAKGDAVEQWRPEHHQREQYADEGRDQVLLRAVGAHIAEGKRGQALQQHPFLRAPGQAQAVAAHGAPGKQGGGREAETVDHGNDGGDIAQLQGDGPEGGTPDQAGNDEQERRGHRASIRASRGDGESWLLENVEFMKIFTLLSSKYFPDCIFEGDRHASLTADQSMERACVCGRDRCDCHLAAPFCLARCRRIRLSACAGKQINA